MFRRNRVIFRPLEHDDLALIYRWLQDPEVSRWYSPAPLTLAEIQARYGPRIDGQKGIDGYLVLYDGTPVGYIQTYVIADQPEYAEALSVDPGAAGVDMFVGEPGFRHRGFGPTALQEFVRRIVLADARVTCCVIAPALGNESAKRAYAKAGFRHVKTVPVPGEEQPEYVMMLWPDELPARITELDRGSERQ